MELNAKFDERVAVHAAALPWQTSPMVGVERRMLDRIGDEVARATTIVRYAPGSHFSPHVHTGGEEFLVLEGVFQDEHGDWPAGSYLRNPPQSSHTPRSETGCIIFVKLWQFDLSDRTQVRLDTNAMEYTATHDQPGVSAMQLFEDDREQVCLERWDTDQAIPLLADKGMEILVLDGSFEESGEIFQRQSWLRLPKNSRANAQVGSAGARVWIKRNHLAVAPAAPAV